MVNEVNPSKAQLGWEKILPFLFCVKIISHESTNGEWSSLICDTLPETNIAPEDRLSRKETSLPTIHFQVRMSVSFREGRF